MTIFFILFFLLTPNLASAREGFSLGAMGLGNFFFANGEFATGPGGGLMLDYRFNQRWSLETDLFFSVQDGKGLLAGDHNAYLLGLPSVELKFYPLREEHPFEPYILAGLGVYILTEGSIDNSTSGAGLGGDVGVGVDMYITRHFSFGIAAKFRPIALVQANNRSSALINLGLNGNFVWHFK